MFDAIAADYYEIISTVAAAGTWVSTVRISPVQGIGSRAPERATSSAPLRIAANYLR